MQQGHKCAVGGRKYEPKVTLFNAIPSYRCHTNLLQSLYCGGAIDLLAMKSGLDDFTIDTLFCY